MKNKLREKVGCWLHEQKWMELVIRLPNMAARMGLSWLDCCNRNEQVTKDPVSGGRICHWEDSSALTVSRIFPETGNRLLQHCRKQYPFKFEYGERSGSNTPEVSILIAVSGKDRLPQFELVLASLRAQSYSQMEIIVVEQSDEGVLEQKLPQDIRYLATPGCVEGFNKSRALNEAARLAIGKYIFIHDADYVVPASYVEEGVKVLEHADAIRPARLIFYLDKTGTEQVLSCGGMPEKCSVEKVIQNNPTPLALRKETYWEIGGHDERFYGWGGEDVEFLDRLRTMRISEGGWLPIVHLWHQPAPKKESGHRNIDAQQKRLQISVKQRIIDLWAQNVEKVRA